MPDHRGRRRSPARVVAPVALLVCAVALATVVLSSPAVDGDDSGATATTERTTTNPSRETDRRARRQRRNYVVKAGDTLGAIAEQTGVSVERLLVLNPELDPQALVAGQRIRLRE
jgi:Tfp pilus assembly protein FimV